MTEIELKTGITDAECERMDKYYTENTFEPGPNLLKLGVKPGFVTSTLLLTDLAPEVAAYLRAQTKTLHKSLAEIINDVIREKLAIDV